MQRGCGTVRKRAKLFCSLAPDFANFPAKIGQVVEKVSAPGFSLLNSNQTEAVRAGIVMVVYPKLLAGAYASIRTLREVLRCQLPIEIWFRPVEMQNVPAGLKLLKEAAKVDAMDGVTFRAIDDLRAVRFAAKVHAIYNSAFDQVLFLDADNVPVRDPAFLFESEEFVGTGAVFWPDYWHPHHTIFHLVEDSLLWQMLDMQYVDMFEQESGQLLIDRRRHAAAMELVHFYASHTPDLFKHLDLLWGDKDLFRFAWIELNAPFFMVQTLPAVAGKLVNESFCGMTMVQHDFNGNVLFIHRNTNELTERPQRNNVNHVFGPLEPDNLPDPVIGTHPWSFRNSSRRNDYRIESYRAPPEFPEWQRCYGKRHLHNNELFYTQKFEDLSFFELGTHLRRFAIEGIQQLAKLDAAMKKDTR
uniref:Nucleotide-diphospho-sugar transferase n=1 Tax=Peronospora matthiolae TaxID=2874970 RepID=A0AAV1TY88_9STRA